MQGVVEGSGVMLRRGIRRKRCWPGWRYCNAGRGAARESTAAATVT